jgi:hypothetical protein
MTLDRKFQARNPIEPRNPESKIRSVKDVGTMLKSRLGWAFFWTLLLDVPEALGLVAPVRLRLVGSHVPSFATTREIYDRAGAESSLVFD